MDLLVTVKTKGALSKIKVLSLFLKVGSPNWELVPQDSRSFITVMNTVHSYILKLIMYN